MPGPSSRAWNFLSKNKAIFLGVSERGLELAQMNPKVPPNDCWANCIIKYNSGLFLSHAPVILHLWSHEDTEDGHQPSCFHILLRVASPQVCGQQFSTEADGKYSSNHRPSAVPQTSFVEYYLACSQISTDQKAWAGDGMELELLHRVIIDYASNSTAAHWLWIQLEVIIHFKHVSSWKGWNLQRTLGIPAW